MDFFITITIDCCMCLMYVAYSIINNYAYCIYLTINLAIVPLPTPYPLPRFYGDKPKRGLLYSPLGT